MYGRLCFIAALAGLALVPASRQTGAVSDAPTRAHASAQREQREQRANIPPQTEESRQLGAQVETAKKRAFGGGSYACCVQPACSWCMLHTGHCACALTLGERHRICRECHGGWEAGEGRIPGFSREDVRKMGAYGHEQKK